MAANVRRRILRAFEQFFLESAQGREQDGTLLRVQRVGNDHETVDVQVPALCGPRGQHPPQAHAEDHRETEAEAERQRGKESETQTK